MERELEKTLLEIASSIKDHERRGNTHTQSVLEQARDIIGMCAQAARTPSDLKEILDRETTGGWIPAKERLPMRTLDEKINESYQKYLVFIDGVDGWDIDIAVYDFWNDKKWREAHDGYGEIENVIAWRPLPEPYRPERSVEE